MPDFHSVLNDAMQLSEAERVQLLNALWDAAPEDTELPLHPEWEAEIARRVADLDSGTAKTVPWETVRDASLERIRNAARD